MIAGMLRHELLAELHERLRPRNYLEIGIGRGESLTLSHVPSIGVDPGFRIATALPADVRLIRETSDEFFARPNPLGFLQGGRNPIRNIRHHRPPLARFVGKPTVDLAFIDGMHLFEYALRDFVNVERYSAPTTVIVLDDMLPRNDVEAARERTQNDWTGDVYKLIDVLRRHRPDLISITLDTQPTGLLVVLLPDRTNTVLTQRMDEIVADNVVDGRPETVPASIIGREGAIDPAAFLATGWCRTIARSRVPWVSAAALRDQLRHDLDGILERSAMPRPTQGVMP